MTPPEVTFVTSAEGFDDLRADWERCLERAAGASIFVTFEWLRTWWKHYSVGRQLRIAVARQDGVVTGILPLYIGTAPLLPGLPARVLRLLGSGADTSPDYLGAIVDETRQEPTLEALCRAAACSEGWDAIDFTDVLESSAFFAQMRSALRAGGMPSWRAPGWSIPIVRLPPTWSDCLGSLSRHNVKHLQRRRRLWEQRGGRLFTWAGDQPLDDVIERLGELHRLRWRDQGEAHAFSSASYVAFHRDVMHALAARGRLRLYCLAEGQTLAAVLYCYTFHGEVAHFQSGFDPRHHAMSPGATLIAFGIEEAIGEGARVFDMLKGDYPHKATWANDRRVTAGLRAYGPGLRGQLLRARREVLAPLRYGSAPAGSAHPERAASDT